MSKSLVAAACALSMAFYGCSVKSGKTTTKVIPTDPGKTDGKIATVVDSLLNANKGKGKGVVIGFLTGEGKSIAQGLLKQASNAAGERRLLTKAEIPLTGATVLIFNALKPTTAPDTTLTTDTAGNYTAVLPEGKYFGFAVHLDLETFQLVTTSIPNMNPKADTVTRMDTATAIEDVTAPTVAGVYDAASPNGDGIFLVGSVPDKDAKINITFSEPMSRTSAAGVVLGRIDTTNTSASMVLADTVEGVTQTWSGDSRELTLSVSGLATGAQYGLILPVGLKDLAKNPLGKEYKATFVTVSAKVLAGVPFSVSSTVPDDQGTLKPIQNPSVSFNRPVEAFSILKNAKIVPAVTGYFEISGVRAVFIHKDPLIVGQNYTVTLPASVTDLSGQALPKDFSFSFTVKDFDGAAKTSTGRQQEVALAVEAAFDAYLSGDVGRFGASFSANFRLYNDDGSIKSKSEFLDQIGKEVGDKQAQAAGFPGPVFDNSADACKNNNVNRWKVGADGGTADDVLWVDAYMSPGQSPGVYGADKAPIDRSALTWDPTGPRFTYKGKKYGFGPDMTKFHGPVNMDAAKNDLRFMGTLLQQTSTVVLEDVKLEDRTEFNVDTNVAISGDTARLAVRMIDYNKYNRLNFGYNDIACNTSLSDTSYQVLKFMLVNDGSKWVITSIVSPSKQTNKEDFNKQVDVSNFQVRRVLPINLIAPLKDNAADSAGKVAFRFKGIVNDTLGGYIVGIAEDPKFCFGRAPYGALIFVKASNKKGDEESFVLNSAGGPEGANASMILRRAQDLKLPGWESYLFDNVITAMVDVSKGFGGVYQWKVIAVKDTSAAQFLANGFSPDRYYGESDFGTAKGYFACKAFPQGDAAFNALQANQQQFVSTQTAVVGSFSDMDLDGVPDNIEIKYKTDPKNRNSYPDFSVDTDGDGIADFLEAMLDPTGKDSLIYKKADAAGVKAELARLTSKEFGIIWQDTDGDGFPDDIEMLYGFNPNDPASHPGTRPRANAPIGVFAGKIQVGGSLYDISFKLYTDTAKNLFTAYTAYVGKDTLADTVRSSFNELAGEVYIAVTLPKNGPDAGRALLLRGHYDANMSLLMGPIDMITAVDKASVNFGGGPNVGQFAASGRGEDVGRYLPQNGGTAGTAVNNPANAGAVVISYRQPPAGVSEGSKLVFANGVITLINDFGDTVAVVDNVQFRGQPDGSIQFNGEVQVNVGADYKRSQVGGTILLSGDGWVVDGSLYQESVLAGVRKQIPGQINGKAAKTDVQLVDGSKFKNPSPQAVEGTFKGWIAQDKTGSGFAAVNTPGNTGTACDPTKGDCSGNQPCDPTKATCTGTPTNCPAGQTCNTGNTGTTTNPANSYSKVFAAGASQFKMWLDKSGYKAGDYFFVSWGGHVYKVKYDSTGIQDAKAPLCGQVVLTPGLIGAKDATAASLAGVVSDSLAMQTMASTAIFAIEDPAQPGVPARIDKARDAQGDVLANVFVIEMRPVPADYGKSTATCQGAGGIVGNPACDPTKGSCSTPCDPTKGACNNPAPCDSTKGPCGPVTGPVNGGNQPGPYVGTLDAVKTALAASQNKVGLVKDSTGNIAATLLVDSASLFSDANLHFVLVTQAGATNRFRFLGQAADPKSLIIKDGVPLVVADQNAGGTGPVDTGKVANNPVDTTKPPVYKGTLDSLRQLLIAKGGKVKVGTPNGPVDVAVNIETLMSDGTVITATDSNSAAKIYVFLGDRVDPTKPLLAPDGNILVVEKITVAGP